MQTGNLTKLLVIEDSLLDSYLLTHQLGRAKIDECITVVADGKEALEFLLAASPLPLAVFLDLNLPGLSGIDVLRRMKKEPRLQDIPVIVMTGSLHSKDVDECGKLGVSAYLTKPVTLDTFLKTVTQFFPAALSSQKA